MNWKGQLFSLVAIFLIGYLGYLLVKSEGLPDNKIYFEFGAELPAAYDLLGIDVSHYQDQINWKQLSDMNVQNDSVEFVYIKATEGTSLVDEQMKSNIQGANKFGVMAGFYHFFRPGISAEKQADYFVDNAYQYNYQLLPVLDVEINTELSKTALNDSVQVFLNHIEKRIDERPLIYTNANFYNDYFEAEEWCKNEYFWIAQYAADCELMQLENVLLWQFSDKGTVSGINERVDLNKAKASFFEIARIKK